MAIAFDGSYAPDVLPAMPCGGVPEFDDGSGYSYRCNQCGATVGSIAMPPECKRALDARQAKRAASAGDNASPVRVYDATKAKSASRSFLVTF